MGSGSSYYVSVKTPRTKTRSVISSKYHGTGSRKRGSNKFSFFKKASDYHSDMNKTANEGFPNTAKKLKKRGITSLSNSHSQRGISEGQKLFQNNGIADKMSPGVVQGAYGTYDNRKTSTISVHTKSKDHIPYPHLAAFINKHSGGVHFGKRMNINNKQSTNEIFRDQHKQIEDKKLKKELEKSTLK